MSFLCGAYAAASCALLRRSRMPQSVVTLCNARAAVGCVLPCRIQIPKRMSSLCSACAAVGCALPSSQAHALERRYPAVRAPLWAAHCLRCIRMLKNFVASERPRSSAVRPPLWAAHCLRRIRMPTSSQCRCACAALGRALPSMHPNAEVRRIRTPKKFGSASAAVGRALPASHPFAHCHLNAEKTSQCQKRSFLSNMTTKK